MATSDDNSMNDGASMDGFSVTNFDLPRFIQAFIDFWKDEVPEMPDHEVAFAIVGDDGSAEFGSDGLVFADEDVGDTPMEWLQHGVTLFAQFTRQEDRSFEGLDGTKWREPQGDQYDGDLEEDEEIFNAVWEEIRQENGGELPPSTIDMGDDDDSVGWHELAGCEIGSYGFLVSLSGEQISLQPALLEEVNGECKVRVIKDAGPFQEPMRRFLDSMRQ